MHVLQYVAVKATDVDDAIQNARIGLEDCVERGENWFDWFSEDGGRWASTDKPISHKNQPQEFAEKFAWLMNHRRAELDHLVKRLGDTGYDLADLLSLYDPLEPLSGDKSNALYGLGKIINILFCEWDYNSGFYDLENETAAPFGLADVINSCNSDTATGAADDDETWWLVPVDFHF